MAPQSENVKGLLPSRYDDITKSCQDNREYRGVILPNDMKVLLISDDATEKSAAALSVNVGYMSDPDELPGLAHFCEHMLFLGTKKYPGENDYHKYLTEHGGSCNATTDMDETKFFFDVAPDNLMDILDIFSQFFIAPTFSESATEREINAVDSEHLKNIPNDVWRCDYIDKFLCNPKHPYHKFGTGNKQTLSEIPKQKGIHLREALLKFHGQWYSSNIMTLVILGKESLDILEKMAVDLFSRVENKKVEAPIWNEHPFSSEHLATNTLVVPIKDIRAMNITFPVPDLLSYYKSAPASYLSHLFGHEGPGSLLSVLKSHGWSTKYVPRLSWNSYALSGGSQPRRGFRFFKIDADLTEEGMEHIEDIMQLVFQYVNMLKRDGPQQWIFEEYSTISNMHFRFKDKEVPRSYVSALSSRLRYFPLSEILCGPYLMSEWNPNIIKSVLEDFTPEKARVLVVAKKHEPVCDQLEPIYSIKYHREKFSKQLLDRLCNTNYCQELKLPQPNEFIPKDFSTQQLQGVTPHPAIILDTPQLRIWFKQDSEFQMPKLNIYLQLTSPLVYLDPLNYNLTNLFVQLFQDSLNEYAYAAELAGLRWFMASFKHGIMLNIGGYNDKLDLLLKKIIDHMKDFTIDENRFEIFREKYIRHLKNFEADQPYHLAIYYLGMLLTEHSWSNEELLQASNYTTVENLKSFLPQLLSKLHVEGIFHGNCDKTQALGLSKLIEDGLNLNDHPPLLAQQLLNNREHKLESGIQYIFDVANMYHKSSCTELFYQCGLQSTKTNMLLELLVQIISEPCFNILRTKEQLGYIVSCTVRRSNGAQGLRIIIQSEYPPSYVDYRIEEFLSAMKSHLEAASSEEFTRHKEALAVKRLEKPKTLSELTALFWCEISSQEYHFNRAAVEVAYLRTITKPQLLAFFSDQIEKTGTKRKKLAVYISSKLSSVDVPGGLEYPSQEYNEITDFISFKKSRKLFPLVAPFISIPNKGAQSKL